MHRLNMKVGLALVVLLALAALFARGQSQRVNQPQADMRSGRYQLFFGPNARADMFLLDTQTGKIWTRVTYIDVQGKPDIWKAQVRTDSEADFNAWLSQQQFIEEKK